MCSASFCFFFLVILATSRPPVCSVHSWQLCALLSCGPWLLGLLPVTQQEEVTHDLTPSWSLGTLFLDCSGPYRLLGLPPWLLCVLLDIRRAPCLSVPSRAPIELLSARCLLGRSPPFWSLSTPLACGALEALPRSSDPSRHFAILATRRPPDLWLLVISVAPRPLDYLESPGHSAPAWMLDSLQEHVMSRRTPSEPESAAQGGWES